VFTGDKKRGAGLVERASGSTLFLDEIGELPLELQPKVLQILDEAEWGPEGENRTSHANIRVVAASTQVLGDEVAAGRFRADLYYRIAGFVIHLPTLRERRGDIGPLVQHFVTMHSQKFNCVLQPLSDQALAKLEQLDWPGNVRELRWAVECACIVARNGVLSIDDFAIGAPCALPRKSTRREQGDCACESSMLTLREVERQHIASVLRRCGGVIEGRRGAAVALGLPPSTLRFRIRKHGIEMPLSDQQPHQYQQQTR
jgi:DNA-binding NtrC family response regulator